LALAEHIARHIRSDVLLMRVTEDSASAGEVSDHRAALARMADDIEARGGARPRIMVLSGRPENCILEVAEREGADLIVVAPHERAGLDALRHRSVTARLLTRTTIPLLVAPPRMESAWYSADLLSAATSLVIVPVDGSALSEQAIVVGQRIAESWRRPLLLVRALEPAILYGAGPELRRLERRAHDEEIQRIHVMMSSLRTRVAHRTGVPVEAMVIPGAAEGVIAHAAASYPGSLIVMSTHGRGAAQRAMLGSVAMGVLRHAREPVLILPPTGPVRRGAAHTAEREAVER
jgi:nucleotide-binding universal stress UspA family protein